MSARCPQHGLKVAADGRCMLCRDEAGARRRSRLAGAALVAVGALLGVGVGGPLQLPLASDTAAETRPARVHASSSRAIEARAGSATDAPLREELGPVAEDAFLAPSLFGEELPVVSQRPPEPARAGTDPEPAIPDDPRDFQLH